MARNILNKYLPLGILILLAVILFFGFKFNLPNLINRTPTPAITISANEAELKIYLSNGGTRIFMGVVSKETTLLDVLYFVSLKNVDFKYSMNKNGVFNLLSFVKVTNTPAKSWHFYVNGKLIKTADVGKTVIKGGSLIEAKFE